MSACYGPAAIPDGAFTGAVPLAPEDEPPAARLASVDLTVELVDRKRIGHAPDISRPKQEPDSHA